MDLTKPISELRRQRDEINQAINALERLQSSCRTKTGRPPKCLAEAQADKPGASGIARRAGSPLVMSVR
jgi:hypothetical protein